MCGWLAATASVGPSERTSSSAASSTKPTQSKSRVALGRPHDHRLLPDADLRLRPQAPEVGLDLARDDAGAALAQLAEGGPALTLRGHPLTLVLADDARPQGGSGRSAVSTAHVSQIQITRTTVPARPDLTTAPRLGLREDARVILHLRAAVEQLYAVMPA